MKSKIFIIYNLRVDSPNPYSSVLFWKQKLHAEDFHICNCIYSVWKSPFGLNTLFNLGQRFMGKQQNTYPERENISQSITWFSFRKRTFAELVFKQPVYHVLVSWNYRRHCVQHCMFTNFFPILSNMRHASLDFVILILVILYWMDRRPQYLFLTYMSPINP